MSPGDRWAQTKRAGGPGPTRPRCQGTGPPTPGGAAGDERTYVRYTWAPWATRWRSGGREPTTTAASPCSSPRRSSSTATSGIGEYRGLEFLHVNARRVINEVPAASRMPFRFTINAYRGCSHACAYCFARPTHEYLGLGMGEDFERKLVVKVNAVERVRAELRSPRWHGEHIAMGTNTDPYQRAEGRYHLTRGIVEALGEAAQPLLDPHQVDADPARPRPSRRRRGRAPTCTATSPSAPSTNRCGRPPSPARPHPRRRVEAVRRLNDAGIPTGVLMAPIIPGWSDAPEQLEEVATACVEAGAVFVTPIALHLRRGVKEHFLAFVKEHHPDRHAALARRYARSAYLPPGEQRRHRRAGPRRGGRPTRRRRSTADTFGHPAAPHRGRRRTRPLADPGPPVEQLALCLRSEPAVTGRSAWADGASGSSMRRPWR